jgi:RNA polymerase sigma-70 factor (ECF subfamily)
MFLAARGYGPQDQQDLVQEFFLNWLRSRAWKRADRLRGKFRTFMLGAVTHLLAHEAAKKAALKRGGGLEVMSLDANATLNLELPMMDAHSSATFDRGWAVALVTHAITALRAEFAAREKMAEFEVLRLFLPGSTAASSLEAAAARLGTNVNAFKAALHRLRERFRELLRLEVARTVSAPHEIEEELRYLRTLLLALPAEHILAEKNRKIE